MKFVQMYCFELISKFYNLLCIIYLRKQNVFYQSYSLFYITNLTEQLAKILILLIHSLTSFCMCSHYTFLFPFKQSA